MINLRLKEKYKHIYIHKAHVTLFANKFHNYADINILKIHKRKKYALAAKQLKYDIEIKSLKQNKSKQFLMDLNFVVKLNEFKKKLRIHQIKS